MGHRGYTASCVPIIMYGPGLFVVVGGKGERKGRVRTGR